MKCGRKLRQFTAIQFVNRIRNDVRDDVMRDAKLS